MCASAAIAASARARAAGRRPYPPQPLTSVRPSARTYTHASRRAPPHDHRRRRRLKIEQFINAVALAFVVLQFLCSVLVGAAFIRS